MFADPGEEFVVAHGAVGERQSGVDDLLVSALKYFVISLAP